MAHSPPDPARHVPPAGLSLRGSTVARPAGALDPSRAVGDGSGRKTDDAAAVAVAGLRSRDLQVVRPDDTVEILPLLSTRRQEVVAPRIATVNRLHEVLCQLIPVGRNGI
jgi:hypothetical protein